MKVKVDFESGFEIGIVGIFKKKIKNYLWRDY